MSGGDANEDGSGRGARISVASVVILVPVLDFGGVETQTVIHARLMAHRVGSLRVCCFTDDGAAARQLRRSGIPVDVLGTSASIRNLRATYGLWKYLRRHRPDVVHARTGALTFHSLVAATVARVPVRIVEEVGIPTRGSVGRRVFPWIYRLASKVIGVSDAVARHLVEHDGVEPAKVIRIYNPVDDRYFEGARQEQPEDCRDAVTVGRLVPEKAHEILLRALAALLADHPSVSLTVVGDGPQRPVLEKEVADLGLTDAVRFLGRQDDVRSILGAADVFILPSRSEGLGLALVEAMAAQVPVIATKVGGIPEVLSSTPEWLVPADDVPALERALRRMLALSSGERTALGTALAEQARALFGAEAYVTELMTLYAETLEAKGRP